MRRKNAGLVAAAAIFMQLLVACDGISDKRETAAREAVTALRKIEAAVQVGASYQQYGTLLLEAKSKVNDANAVLLEGELKPGLTLRWTPTPMRVKCGA